MRKMITLFLFAAVFCSAASAEIVQMRVGLLSETTRVQKKSCEIITASNPARLYFNSADVKRFRPDLFEYPALRVCTTNYGGNKYQVFFYGDGVDPGLPPLDSSRLLIQVFRGDRRSIGEFTAPEIIIDDVNAERLPGNGGELIYPNAGAQSVDIETGEIHFQAGATFKADYDQRTGELLEAWASIPLNFTE